MHIKTLGKTIGESKLSIFSFISYLAETITQILLAPAIAFAITAVVLALKNPSSEVDIQMIFTNCFHSDVLYSILAVNLIIFMECIDLIKTGKAYSDNHILNTLNSILIKFTLAISFLLGIAAVYYGARADSGAQTLIAFFDGVEVFGLSLCVVLQCAANSDRYLVKKS